MTGAAIADTSTDTFEADVLDASFDHPVVVDFWAPWCGPCRHLGPVLERLVTEAQGAWTLARVNVDENPDLASQFGVRGIPDVKGFRDGVVVAGFVGAQPEYNVRAFLQRLMPTPADTKAAEGLRLAEAGDVAAAEEAFREALAAGPDHPRALLGLGRLLAASERRDEAIRALSTLLPGSAEGREAAPLLAELRLAANARDAGSPETARAALERDPHSVEALLELGQSLAASGEYAEALEHLLASVKRDKSFRNGAARTAMLAIFEVLGPDNPLTLEFRRRLASALYV